MYITSTGGSPRPTPSPARKPATTSVEHAHPIILSIGYTAYSIHLVIEHAYPIILTTGY